MSSFNSWIPSTHSLTRSLISDLSRSRTCTLPFSLATSVFIFTQTPRIAPMLGSNEVNITSSSMLFLEPCLQSLYVLLSCLCHINNQYIYQAR